MWSPVRIFSFLLSLSLVFSPLTAHMAYRRKRSYVRKPSRRRASSRRRSSYSRPRSSRRAAPRRQARQKACVCPGELSPTAKFALAQLDPFHPLSLGAKIPDSNTMPSIANCSQDQVACPLATTGFLTGFAFRPFYNYATIAATPASASTVTWGAAVGTNASNRRDYTAFVAQMEASRPVAHAIRLVSQLAPTSATGFVHIGLSVESYYGNSAATWQFPTTVNEMSGLAFYKRVTLASLTQSPLTVINKWIDERGFQYHDPSQSTTIATAPAGEVVSPFGWDWSSIVVLVEGAPTTPSPLSAEHILLTESLPKKDSILIGTQAAPNSPGTISAVSTMASEQDFSHVEAGQESYIDRGLDALARGASTAGEQVFNNVAGPLLQRVGSSAVSFAGNALLNAIGGRGGLPGVNSNPNRLAISH